MTLSTQGDFQYPQFILAVTAASIDAMSLQRAIHNVVFFFAGPNFVIEGSMLVHHVKTRDPDPKPAGPSERRDKKKTKPLPKALYEELCPPAASHGCGYFQHLIRSLHFPK